MAHSENLAYSHFPKRYWASETVACAAINFKKATIKSRYGTMERAIHPSDNLYACASTSGSVYVIQFTSGDAREAHKFLAGDCPTSLFEHTSYYLRVTIFAVSSSVLPY